MSHKDPLYSSLALEKEEVESFSLPEPPRKKGRGLIGIIMAVVFIIAAYSAGKMGVSMALKQMPDAARTLVPADEQKDIVLGQEGEALYLAESPESLRTFFSNYPSPETRAVAPVAASSIRRLQDSVEVTRLRSDADAVQIRVATGAMAGAVYWLHHSQMPKSAAFDPIISPIPQRETE